MEKSSHKKTVKIIALVCIVIVAAVIAGYYLIPVSVLPTKYSKIECRQVRYNGTTYQSDEGFPTEEQSAKIEEILKGYKMKHTTEAVTVDEDFELYIALICYDENGAVVDSRGISLGSDKTAKVRSRPFIDSYSRIENGDELYSELIGILGF
ncbi:MAG: hypothetical protein II164_02230 [Firmicutes bacterium]|nr:hypothetical protein [Bacillota bacterium]